MKEHSIYNERTSQPGYVAPFGPVAGGHWVVFAIALATVGLLLIGLISDDSFSPIPLGLLLGGAIVGLWLNRRSTVLLCPPGHSLVGPRKFRGPSRSTSSRTALTAAAR